MTDVENGGLTPKQRHDQPRFLFSGLRWFNTYRRLCVAALAFNLALMLCAALGRFSTGSTHAVLFAVGNILVAVLFRNEVFLFGLYWCTVNGCLFFHMPLRVRKCATDLLLHIGGLHSGCGVSSLMWLGLTMAHLQQHLHLKITTATVVSIGWVVMGLLLLTCLAAFPVLRWFLHNVFERTHRFAGWSALALLWVFVILADAYDPLTGEYDPHQVVNKSELWIILVITLLIIAPWLSVRRVPVKAITPSKSNTVLEISGGIADGMLGRISRQPLLEWHAFGIMSAGPASNSHSMLIVARGDFTCGLVTDPPSFLWVRCFRFAGLPFCVRMYKSVVAVATGAGIGVVLSSMVQLDPNAIHFHFIWVAKDIPATYGNEVLSLVALIAPQNLTVIDTAAEARPDLANLVCMKAKSMSAEAVFITSNPKVTHQVQRQCMHEGIAAFGPIWDS